ncbi:ATP-binding protein [bacterium]|nr:ATP-binding protein [bacterium]
MILKQVISEVIEHQLWLLESKSLGILRYDLDGIKLYDSFVLVISGIRRCGKSTFLKQVLKSRFNQALFMNFEDPRLSGFELSDFAKIDELTKESQPEVMAFDEIQNVPDWEKYIRTKQDEGQQIIVTGSNASLLSKEFGTRLTGRYISLELFPFSYPEYLQFTGLEVNGESLSRYLDDGGFPEYLKTRDEEVLFRLMDDIIFRDIAVRYGLKQHQTLRQLAIYLISNSGKYYSQNNLKKLFGIGSVRSVSDYVTWLEDSYLLFGMPKFSFSLKKQIYNPKKVYCVDTGLASVNSLSMSKDYGRKLENLIFLHLRKTCKTVYYYSEKNECDFIVVQKGQPTDAIQVCYQLTTDNLSRELKGLEEAMTELKLESGLIITHNQEDSFEVSGKAVKAIPAWKYLTLQNTNP